MGGCCFWLCLSSVTRSMGLWPQVAAAMQTDCQEKGKAEEKQRRQERNSAFQWSE